MLGARFDELRRDYPHSSLVLLSPLAEGADRLAARVALRSGIRLIVPLPMPRAIYDADFGTPEAKQEFEDLLSQAESCFELPLLPGSSTESVSRPGDDRDHEYAKVGAYIATYTHVFIALWDGTPALHGTLIGGTAAIVEFRLKGAPDHYLRRGHQLLSSGGGMVEHLVTPRASAAPPADALTFKMLVPADRTKESLDRLLGRMDLFNRDASAAGSDLRESAERSVAQLLHTDEASLEKTKATLPPASLPVLEQYAVADALSISFGHRELTTTKRLFLGVFLAGALLNLHTFFYHGFFGHHETATLGGRLIAMPWFLLCFLALSAYIALRLHRQAEQGEYQQRHLDYRALAEALRVQFFWSVWGIRDAVAHRYLQRHRSDLEWIRSALLASAVLMSAKETDTPPRLPWPERVRFLVTHWIGDQRAYYASKANRERHTFHREREWSERLLKASVILLAVLAAALTIPLMIPTESMDQFRHLVLLPGVGAGVEYLTVVLAVAAGLLVGFGEQLARAEHVREFTRIGELFAACEQEIDGHVQRRDWERCTPVVLEVGEQALDENGDWLILHRERPLEVPHAG